MAVSVVDSTVGARVSSNNAAGTCTATLSTTPAAGDIVYAYVVSSANPLGNPTVAGLGATWVQQSTMTWVGNMRYFLFRGTGATSAGTITASFPASTSNLQVGAFLARGLTNTTVTWHDQSAWTTSDAMGAATFRRATAPVGPGSLALVVFMDASNGTNTQVPSAGDTAGWTMLAMPGVSFYIGALAVNAVTTIQLTDAPPVASPTQYVSYSTDIIGGPDGARALAGYAEAATSNPSAAALSAVYAEAASGGPGATAAQAAYLEALTVTVTTIVAQGAYLEVLTSPPSSYRHGWGLVLRGG